MKQYLEEQKGADALYSDNVDLTALCQWIQEACLRVGGRDNREIKKEAKELKQALDTEGAFKCNRGAIGTVHVLPESSCESSRNL